MYQNIYQNWEHMTQSFQEPMQKLISLNIETMNESFGNLSKKREELDPSLTSKSPEKLFQAQVKMISELTNDNIHLLQNYTKKLSEITENFVQEFNHNVTEMGQDAMKQNVDNMKQSTHSSKKN